MLYAYFGNKEQLFEAVFALMVTAATTRSRSTPATCRPMRSPCSSATGRTRTWRGCRTGTAWSTASPARTTRFGRPARQARGHRRGPARQGDQRPAQTAGAVRRDHRAHPDGHPGIHPPQPADQHRSRPDRRARHREAVGPALMGRFAAGAARPSPLVFQRRLRRQGTRRRLTAAPGRSPLTVVLQNQPFGKSNSLRAGQTLRRTRSAFGSALAAQCPSSPAARASETNWSGLLLDQVAGWPPPCGRARRASNCGSRGWRR